MEEFFQEQELLDCGQLILRIKDVQAGNHMKASNIDSSNWKDFSSAQEKWSKLLKTSLQLSD